MPKYRKKPVVIEAWHWTFAEGCEDPPAWMNTALFEYSQREPPLGSAAFWPDGKPRETPNGLVFEHGPHIEIVTLEGVMRANPGDYIIRGVKGEIYPCKPDVFAATYERVADVVIPDDPSHPRLDPTSGPGEIGDVLGEAS